MKIVIFFYFISSKKIMVQKQSVFTTSAFPCLSSKSTGLLYHQFKSHNKLLLFEIRRGRVAIRLSVCQLWLGHSSGNYSTWMNDEMMNKTIQVFSESSRCVHPSGRRQLCKKRPFLLSIIILQISQLMQICHSLALYICLKPFIF